MEKLATGKPTSRPLRAVCCSPTTDTSWNWLTSAAPELNVSWILVYKRRPEMLLHRLRRPDFAKISSCWRAVRCAKRVDADLLVSHEAEMTFWCSIFARILGLRARHVAYSFNYPFRPSQPRRAAMSFALQSVSEFVVYSKMEIGLYDEYFGLLESRMRFAHWRMACPQVKESAPIVSGQYVVAIGEFGRDYRHFVDAAIRMPDKSFVIVARQKSFPADLILPSNVQVLFDIEAELAFGILANATVMVLPLAGDSIAAGHITLVAAMFLRTPIVAAASSGIEDYVRDGENALLYPALEVGALVKQISTLLNDEQLQEKLADAGRHFAEQFCSEASAEQDYRAFVDREVALLRKVDPVIPPKFRGVRE